MEIIYIIIALILLVGLCFYIAKNFAEIAGFILKGEKITKQDKKGLKFLNTNKSLYLFVSISIAFMMLSGVMFDGWQAKIFYSICSVLLLAGFFMDITVKLLPDLFTISLLWVALFGSTVGITTLDSSQAIIASIVLYVMFMVVDLIGDIIFKKTVIGGGDIKLMAAFGALFGVLNSMIILFIACFIMIVFVSSLKLLGKKRDKELPFGLGLTSAAMLGMFSPVVLESIFNLFSI